MTRFPLTLVAPRPVGASGAFIDELRTYKSRPRYVLSPTLKNAR